jgi:hypothetical protein
MNMSDATQGRNLASNFLCVKRMMSNLQSLIESLKIQTTIRGPSFANENLDLVSLT